MIQNLAQITLAVARNMGERGQEINYYNVEKMQRETCYDFDHEMKLRQLDCEVLAWLADKLYIQGTILYEKCQLRHGAAYNALDTLFKAIKALKGGHKKEYPYEPFPDHSQHLIWLASQFIYMALDEPLHPSNIINPAPSYTMLYDKLHEMAVCAQQHYHRTRYNDIKEPVTA